jgi:Chitobiase/beta-hexosaminidase C-terminal domain/Bacterial Ig-like domain (group 3)/FG-GAP-like repeat/FG-GAP repeat
MPPRKNSVSCHRIFDSLGFTLVYRMLPHAVRFAGAASLFVGIAAGGAASAQTRAATVTSLSVSASGSETSSVAAGTVVTLTAHVTAGGANVSSGQVNFCDATAAYCMDIHILATAQLTSSGTATYKFRPGIGSHSYKAVFVGTKSYAGSISSALSLTVTGTAGPFATATSIAETGAWGDYTLTGTVTEAGGTIAPTGTVSFLDSSNGNSVLATGSLGPAVAGIGWPNPKSLTNTLDTYFVLVADLNGDGIPDLVLGSNQVSIYLGNAGGTYTKAAMPSIQGPTSYPIVIADFNGDGIPDLAVPLYGSNDIAILLGKGDGTFAVPVMASVPGSIVDITQIVVGDFNGDGIPDLAVIDSDSSTLDILLGNGDGTFTAETTRPPISGIPLHFATGDFNTDGKTDLAVAENGGTIAILLGNGDGTFAASGSVNSASSNSPIAVADFNGDGKLDIAVAAGIGTSESVIVLTGNGDGTFNSPSSGQNPTSTSVTWIQVADFNQDSAPDLVLADSSGSATVFLNNGGGSLNESFSVVSGLTVPYYLEVGVGDLNGDGYPDIVGGGYYNNSQGLYLTEPTETAHASANVQVNGVGHHLAQASFPAEGKYESSVSNSIPLWGLLPATSTTLSVTSGGSTVTSVTPGTAVLLTAHVSAGTTPVTAGQVNFCDASAPHCTDIHILGSGALNSSGGATFKFVPGPGTHSYQAQFVEDGFGLASASNVASLKVGPAPSPVYSDTAAITSNGSPGDYSLTATVTGYGGPASPTGAVSFVDTSFGNNVLATASLGTGIPGIGFLESLSPTFGSYPNNEVTADFNGDGIPDLAILSTNNAYGGPYTVAVFLGNGDGTFRAGPTIQPSGMQVYPFMISGDFNADGKPDLAILSYDGYSTSYLTILLNNGDGSFSAKPTVVAFQQGSVGGDIVPRAIAAGDFNGDGKLDLAVVGDYVSAEGVTILLGNGDGTFTAAGPNLDPSGDFALIATGDFNGDGVPDLVSPNYFEFGGSPTIFLGKGDGTFTFKKTSFTLDYFPTSVVVGDFNGDGVLDLAFSDLNGVEIALGNGDGTFNETSASPIQVPSELYSLQAGDFNHDGKLDLAGLDNYFDQIVVLLGAGDGTFAVTKATPVVSTSFVGPFQIAAADFNGDGVPDLAMLTKGVNTASILLTEPTETATATVNAIAPVGAGTHNVDASYAGDSHYSAVTSSTIPLFTGLAPLVVTPAAGTYTSVQTLAITEAIPGSTIYYELTGAVSTNGYVQYTGPVALPYGGVEALQAYATETGYQQSNNLLAQYTLNYPATPAPAFSLPAGSYSGVQSLTITDSLARATIYYTTDGTTPTTSSTEYTGPIIVSSTETIEAIAAATGYSTSAVVTAAYTITISAPGFALSASPVSVSVPQGGSGTSTISATDVGGFTGTVTLAATGLPSGVSASFAPGSAAGTQVLTLTASTSAPITSSAVTITGTSGSLSATTTADLSITAEPGVAPGSGGTTSLTVTPGTTTGNTGTISVAGTNGFSGVVDLTCSVTTTLTSVSDMPTCSLNPTSVTISGAAAQTSTLTVNTTAASSAENQERRLFWPSASGATFALVLLFVRPRKRKDRVALIGLLLLFVSTGFIGCGGGSIGGGGGSGNGGTTPGAYTITVTGTSGSVSATVGAVALTVQ